MDKGVVAWYGVKNIMQLTHPIMRHCRLLSQYCVNVANQPKQLLNVAMVWLEFVVLSLKLHPHNGIQFHPERRRERKRKKGNQFQFFLKVSRIQFQFSTC